MKTIKSFFLVLALLINVPNLLGHTLKESIESQDRTPHSPQGMFIDILMKLLPFLIFNLI